MLDIIKSYLTNEENELNSIGMPKVRKEFSKKMIRKDGTVMYFIQKNHGIKRGLMNKMNFRTLHSADNSFCEIIIELERYGKY